MEPTPLSWEPVGTSSACVEPAPAASRLWSASAKGSRPGSVASALSGADGTPLSRLSGRDTESAAGAHELELSAQAPAGWGSGGAAEAGAAIVSWYGSCTPILCSVTSPSGGGGGGGGGDGSLSGVELSRRVRPGAAPAVPRAGTRS